MRVRVQHPVPAEVEVAEHAHDPRRDEIQVWLPGADDPIEVIGGSAIDGPDVIQDDEGPLVSCQLCGHVEGFPAGAIGQALARTEAGAHRCPTMTVAFAVLRQATASLNSS